MGIHLIATPLDNLWRVTFWKGATSNLSPPVIFIASLQTYPKTNLLLRFAKKTVYQLWKNPEIFQYFQKSLACKILNFVAPMHLFTNKCISKQVFSLFYLKSSVGWCWAEKRTGVFDFGLRLCFEPFDSDFGLVNHKIFVFKNSQSLGIFRPK